MLKRDEWLDLARKLDWELSYVREEDAFPEVTSGCPWLPHAAWCDWDEPFRTSYCEYVLNQTSKEMAVCAVRDAVGRIDDFQQLSQAWLNSVKLHVAALPLAEFAAVVGNPRGARFGRDSAWRTMATFGALDELRHTQIPLQIMHELVKWDPQFDWTHKFYHTNHWMAVAGRHLMDELLLGSSAIDFAVATNFVFETGFTNLQFVALAAVAQKAGDRMFERMVTSIQTDEARHSQIGRAVLATVIQHDPDRAQYLLDKRKYVFCSTPCRWIFEQEVGRYKNHKNIVNRMLEGEAPANLITLMKQYFGLTPSTWGRDCFGGKYPWLERVPKPRPASTRPNTSPRPDLPGEALAGPAANGFSREED